MMNDIFQQLNSQFNLTCSEHKKLIQFIYFKPNTQQLLTCAKCFLQNRLEHDYILDIEDLLNNKDFSDLNKLFPVLSEGSQQYLNSECMKQSYKDILIENVEKQFNEFADLMLSNLNKLKNQLINHINSTEDERLTLFKLYNQTAFIEDLKALIYQFSNDPVQLNDQLKQIFSKKSQSFNDDKMKIEDSIKNHMNLSKQIDIEYIENSLQAILQKVMSTNILLQDHNNSQSNLMLNDIQQSLLLQKVIKINSQQLEFVQNINIDLPSFQREDYDIKTIFDVLKQCKNLYQIILNLDNSGIDDSDIHYLCILISQIKHLTKIELYLSNNENITEKGIIQLMETLSQYSARIQLIYLNFNGNKNISDVVVLTFILPVFSSCMNLFQLGLHIQNTNIGGKTIKQIGNMLQSLPNIINLKLNLSQNNLDDDESITYLCNEGIKSLNPQIQVLDLWLFHNQLTDQSVLSLINTISTCSHLTELYLDLSYNRIGEQCILQLQQFELSLKDQYCRNLIERDMYYGSQQ